MIATGYFAFHPFLLTESKSMLLGGFQVGHPDFRPASQMIKEVRKSEMTPSMYSPRVNKSTFDFKERRA
jgi:hypothetical protein